MGKSGNSQEFIATQLLSRPGSGASAERRPAALVGDDVRRRSTATIAHASSVRVRRASCSSNIECSPTFHFPLCRRRRQESLKLFPLSAFRFPLFPVCQRARLRARCAHISSHARHLTTLRSAPNPTVSKTRRKIQKKLKPLKPLKKKSPHPTRADRFQKKIGHNLGTPHKHHPEKILKNSVNPV